MIAHHLRYDLLNFAHELLASCVEVFQLFAIEAQLIVPRLAKPSEAFMQRRLSSLLIYEHACFHLKNMMSTILLLRRQCGAKKFTATFVQDEAES